MLCTEGLSRLWTDLCGSLFGRSDEPRRAEARAREGDSDEEEKEREAAPGLGNGGHRLQVPQPPRVVE